MVAIAIGDRQYDLKRQTEKEYLMEIYKGKKDKHNKFDFQALLDKETERLNGEENQNRQSAVQA